MNQNLLIVDDEWEILLGLEELFRYEFDRDIDVYTANSAPEALRLLNQIRFDIVLTDIKMPGMNGITLYQKVKENWPRCKTVFLTGYQNFDDIYQVINNQEVRYILKSEEDEVILGAVRDAFDEVERELEQEQNQKKQEALLKNAQIWMQKAVFDQMISGELSGSKAEEQLKELKISLQSDRPVLLFLLHMDEKDEKEFKGYYLSECLCQVIQENMPKRVNLFLHVLNLRELVLFIQPENPKECTMQETFVIAKGAVEYSQEVFKNTFQNTFSGVLGKKETQLVYCQEQMKSLKQDMVMYLGKEHGILISNEKKNLEEEKVIQEAGSVISRLAPLRSYLELRKKEEFFETLQECFLLIRTKKSFHDSAALEDYYSIAVLLLQFINENHLTDQLAFQVALYKLTRADLHQDWEEATVYLAEVANAIFRVMDCNEVTLTERILDRVIVYIEEHISEDLSLTGLAEISGFNASYLSRLFKQVQRENISDYILHKRMKLAKKMLLEGNEKIQDIAMKTGYVSAHSFARVFRKEEGISPKEFREIGKEHG